MHMHEYNNEEHKAGVDSVCREPLRAQRFGRGVLGWLRLERIKTEKSTRSKIIAFPDHVCFIFEPGREVEEAILKQSSMLFRWPSFSSSWFYCVWGGKLLMTTVLRFMWTWNHDQSKKHKRQVYREYWSFRANRVDKPHKSSLSPSSCWGKFHTGVHRLKQIWDQGVLTHHIHILYDSRNQRIPICVCSL